MILSLSCAYITLPSGELRPARARHRSESDRRGRMTSARQVAMPGLTDSCFELEGRLAQWPVLRCRRIAADRSVSPMEPTQYASNASSSLDVGLRRVASWTCISSGGPVNRPRCISICTRGRRRSSSSAEPSVDGPGVRDSPVIVEGCGFAVSGPPYSWVSLVTSVSESLPKSAQIHFV